ncbi:biotin--[acetyl-CoA-carboxylase] ligase [Cardinium endosymbiont of Oedothorax gibbosus]|uniref:biotin--[acetyl-CoA-carboxylase] ligase n=1 Tax=Cardinium endosymbiont of Oedothorax gibbosus TaxID=931101 RepID=UPI002111DA43|nr:biotin--[acetyl-CoA-carboxylase] ligase [Cardinium endosymbiont of Oedothorax gibbosus]CAH2559965.1 Biotin--acetyl-CoA-carboxylase ligase family protein [Cardinium endosymbiont of Oedothorax gibbosus]
MDYLFDPFNSAIQPDGLFDRASFYYKSCSSTNDMAQKLLLHAAEGTVFIAEHQSKGRGQRGSTWTSEAGTNLLFSFILYPEWLTVDAVFTLNIITSLAIYDVLVDYFPKEISIKWPNDIYYLDKKLGGILIETHIGIQNKIKAAVIGIGLNVNQLHFKSSKCTSLAIQKRTTFDRTLLFTNIMDTLGKYYAQLQHGIRNVLWEKYIHILYRKTGFHTFATIHGLLEGRIVTVNRLGALVIAARNGTRYRYNAKEIVFI